MNVVTARRVPRVAVFWNLAQGLGTLHQWKVTVLTGASQEIFQGYNLGARAIGASLKMRWSVQALPTSLQKKFDFHSSDRGVFYPVGFV
eukprot:793235-Prorocentrum_minimum.AAC.3